MAKWKNEPIEFHDDLPINTESPSAIMRLCRGITSPILSRAKRR